MISLKLLSLAVPAFSLLNLVKAQSFQRLGTCPTLGCIFPPDQTDFLAGQYFDIRLEVHAPVNGSEATGKTTPDTNFTFTVARDGGSPQSAASYFKIAEPTLERWNFAWYEGNSSSLALEINVVPSCWLIKIQDYFARDAKNASLVNVASKIYRRIALYQPGEYTATLTYNGNQKTTASWLVRDLATARKTKNIILFIGNDYQHDQCCTLDRPSNSQWQIPVEIANGPVSSPRPFDDSKLPGKAPSARIAGGLMSRSIRLIPSSPTAQTLRQLYIAATSQQ
ncbi:MAG: hypothetical protein Q9222_005572 [Ikaeria aurantiellina]